MLLIAQPAGAPERAITQLSATALDAVVFSLCGPDSNPAVDHLAARGIPMLGDGSPADPRIAHLALDNRGATARLARHLADLGHERVAHLMMPLRHDSATGPATTDDLAAAEFADTRDRALGFLDVFREALPTSRPTPRTRAWRRPRSPTSSRARSRHGCSSMSRRTAAPPPSSPSPTCWPWAWSGQPRSSGCVCPRT